MQRFFIQRANRVCQNFGRCWKNAAFLLVVVMHKTFTKKNQMHLNTWNCIVQKMIYCNCTQKTVQQQMKNCQCTLSEQRFLLSNDFDIFRNTEKMLSDLQIINFPGVMVERDLGMENTLGLFWRRISPRLNKVPSSGGRSRPRSIKSRPKMSH